MDFAYKSKYVSYIVIIILLFSLFNCSDAAAIIIPKERIITSKNNFLGKWNMQSIVTKSSCPYVIVGTTTESELEIKGVINKISLKADWSGGNWEDSSSDVKLLNENEAIIHRITSMKSTDKNKWKAILIDHLQFDEQNTMHSESIVIQYKNGIPVGEYKTFSVLTKVE